MYMRLFCNTTFWGFRAWSILYQNSLNTNGTGINSFYIDAYEYMRSYGRNNSWNPHSLTTEALVIINNLFNASSTKTYTFAYDDEYITNYMLKNYVNNYASQNMRYKTLDVVLNSATVNNHLSCLSNSWWPSTNFAITWTGFTAALYNSSLALAEGLRCTNDGGQAQDAAQWYEYTAGVSNVKIAAIQKTTGVYLTISDRNFKNDLLLKDNFKDKNYLDRVLNTKIYSYTMKNDTEKHVNVGIIYDEIEQTYNGGCLSKRKVHKDYNKNTNYNDNTKEENLINYQELFLYHILGFQQFYQNKYKTLENKVSELEKINFELKEWNLELLFQINKIKSFINMN